VKDADYGVAVPISTVASPTMNAEHHIPSGTDCRDFKTTGSSPWCGNAGQRLLGRCLADFLPRLKDLISRLRKPMSSETFTCFSGTCGGKAQWLLSKLQKRLYFRGRG